MHHDSDGSRDGILITDTTLLAGGNWDKILIVENTVFAVLTGTISIQGAIADATFVAGEVIEGNFTAIDLASGAVIAYNAR